MKYRIGKTGKKLLRMVLLLLGVSLAAFLLMEASPLDPLKTNVGQAALGSMSQEQIAKLQAYWGAGTPAMERYINWLSGVIKGDWGISLLYRQPVAEVIGQRLANSLWLLFISWILSGGLGMVLGITAGIKRGRLSDKIIRGYCLLISSTPVFWLALVFLMVFSVWLGILPIGMSVPIGALSDNIALADRLRHGILPVLTLSITGVANIALHTREKMIDIMDSDYVLFAQARGESKWAVLKNHGLRNVALPAITLEFASISEILGGSILVEQVFSYPGLGQTLVAAGLGSDLPLLLGITVITSAVVFLGNMTADFLYGAIDPKIRRKGAEYR